MYVSVVCVCLLVCGCMCGVWGGVYMCAGICVCESFVFSIIIISIGPHRGDTNIQQFRNVSNQLFCSYQTFSSFVVIIFIATGSSVHTIM